MAVPNGTSSSVVAGRLEDVLQRARTIKQSTAIDPPLPASEFVTDNEPLFAKAPSDNEQHMIAFETAARNHFYRILGSTPIDHPSFVSMWNLLDILQYCGDQGTCSAQLVLLLVEELLDSQSISGCRIAFTFLESRREAIIANTSKNKDLVILRLCNELLRRLSRAEDPVFCGRVYVFLFQSFPLGDKSSVNLRGNFHVENVTTFEDYLKESAPDGNGMQLDTERLEDVNESSATVEAGTNAIEPNKVEKEPTRTMDFDSLYPVFWSLQHSFANPPRLFEAENFKEFQQGLEATLAKFKEVPKVIQSGDPERSKAVAWLSERDQDDFASTFNPKYLTSRDLFRLELSDLAFQRHILVQALVLIDFLLTLTEKAKKKPYYENAQKAMQYSFTLREEDTEWALGIKNSIANYLQDGPDGKFYYRMVDTVLSRDKNWVRWKMENCHPFTRDRVPANKFQEATLKTKGGLSERTVITPVPQRLQLKFFATTDTHKGLAKLKRTDRSHTPSAESYLNKIREDKLDLDMEFTDQGRRPYEESITSNTWRGLRLASKNRLSSFDRFEPDKGFESLFKRAASVDAAVEDHAPNATEGRDSVPQEQHQSVEEQRAGEQSQVTADTAAE